MRKLRVGLKASPAAAAIFANSPFAEGAVTGRKSERTEVWLHTDRNRTGLLPMMLGLKPFDRSLTWEAARGTEIVVVPLDAPASPKRFFVDAFWTWHVGNAFERDGRIVVDVVRYDDFAASNAWLSKIVDGAVDADTDGFLARAVIDPKAESIAFERLRDRTGEFPRVAPHVEAASHQTLYWTEHSTKAVGHYGPPDTVVRLDVETGDVDAFTFGGGHKPSEAVFAPRPGGEGERDGWLITQVYDPGAHATYWAVLDAAHVSDGPVATAHMDHHVPLSFHGTWVPR